MRIYIYIHTYIYTCGCGLVKNTWSLGHGGRSLQIRTQGHAPHNILINYLYILVSDIDTYIYTYIYICTDIHICLYMYI